MMVLKEIVVSYFVQMFLECLAFVDELLHGFLEQHAWWEDPCTLHRNYIDKLKRRKKERRDGGRDKERERGGEERGGRSYK